MHASVTYQKQVAGLTLISGLLALLCLGLLGIALAGNPAAYDDPMQLLRMPNLNVDLIRWSMLADMFGYYLLLLPAIYFLRSYLRERTPWADLITFCGTAYVLIGAVGAVMMAEVVCPLLAHHWAMTNPGPDGAARVGSRFRIVEAFGRNPKHSVDSTETVTKLDETGIRLVRREWGQEVFSLQHGFEAAPGGTRYRSRMQVGVENWLGRYVINPLLHHWLFTRAMGYAWLKHNVEEVGNFEQFLPDLYGQFHALIDPSGLAPADQLP